MPPMPTDYAKSFCLQVTSNDFYHLRLRVHLLVFDAHINSVVDSCQFLSARVRQMGETPFIIACEFFTKGAKVPCALESGYYGLWSKWNVDWLIYTSVGTYLPIPTSISIDSMQACYQYCNMYSLSSGHGLNFWSRSGAYYVQTLMGWNPTFYKYRFLP